MLRSEEKVSQSTTSTTPGARGDMSVSTVPVSLYGKRLSLERRSDVTHGAFEERAQIRRGLCAPLPVRVGLIRSTADREFDHGLVSFVAVLRWEAPLRGPMEELIPEEDEPR